MRKSLTAVFLALAPVAALTTLAPTAPVQAQQAEVSISLFYDQLSAHGKWVEHPRWGWVWYPADVDRDWRPYTRGRWVWTQEYGWYWASYEPFGWATYHYGRWGYDEQYGWVWVPGDRWAASWVAFRYSDRAIGWAPLPPDTLHVTGSVTIDEGVITANYYQPRWVFVEARYFADPQIFSHVAPIDRNVTFIRETRNVTNITVQNNVFVNRSFEPQRIRAVIGREVPTVRVQRVENANRINIQQNQQTQINTINIYNPQVRVSRDQAPPERARAKQTDRPRVAVKPEFVRPEERRDRAGPNDRTKPGAPPSTGQQDRDRDQQRGPRGQEDKRGATPAQPPTTTPGAPPSRGQPDDKRGATPAQPPKAAPGAPPSRGTQEDRRGATPAQPPKASPGAPPSRGTQEDRRGAMPSQPPKAAPGAPPSHGTQEDRRGATPAQPPKASPGVPPSRGTQEDRRGATPATPATPPKVAPGAPPSRGEPDQKRGATPATPAQPPKVAPGAPPSRGQPQGQQKQQAPTAPRKSDDKDKKEQNPNR